ncbi:MAG: hypothetical protein H6719_38760, partial [Sandaracinaceae bacterium]|nr:hypothetical protein [Sandaracinaceae bacterium]
DGAWRGCPRPDWAIEIAARAGVPPARLIQALAEVDPSDPALAAARAYAAGSLELEPFLDDVRATLSDLVEARPEVRSAVAASRIASRDHHASALHDLDQVYAAAQRELAEVVRRRLSSEDIRVALQGLERHPYR